MQIAKPLREWQEHFRHPHYANIAWNLVACMDSDDGKQVAESDVLSEAMSHLGKAITLLETLKKNVAAAHAQLAYDILAQETSDPDLNFEA
ncbi:MAG: hypothetical protein ACKOPE_07930 [Novosphingobium sp.]